jgi:radical SAM superfamily enzyme YgiQ (UPF0313 family)
MADLTLVNLNMLLVRYIDAIEQELHVPLGPLYLTSSLEAAGVEVDFRDSAPVIGLSCMANLLPFTLLAARELKERYPDRTVVLGGVGPFSVEDKILDRFPWIDMVAHGEGERSAAALMAALREGRDLSAVPGLFYRDRGRIVRTPPAERIEDLDALPPPAFHAIDFEQYAGHNVITSRGCPYACTFCSVAPIWGRKPHFRSPEAIVAEMRSLHDEYGVTLFLFQDEFFVSSKDKVMRFCDALSRSGLGVKWKAFARVNLTDREILKAMARAGCVEIRYGIESGSDRILERVRKGFTIDEAMRVVSEAALHMPRVDTFFIWGYPFETMEDFHQTMFQMISFRLVGARILPSLLCLLPQTEIYLEVRDRAGLEFYPDLFPEYMLTGHEICDDGRLRLSPRHGYIFDFIKSNPDIFPGFFHVDVEKNILPKFEILREHGFYPSKKARVKRTDSCGAHSPRLDAEQVLGAITRPAGR